LACPLFFLAVLAAVPVGAQAQNRNFNKESGNFNMTASISARTP
jgi:hypothetical protein